MSWRQRRAVESVRVDAGGHVWVSTAGAALRLDARGRPARVKVPMPVHAPALLSGDMLVFAEDQGLVATDADGREMWRRPTRGRVRSVGVTPDGAILIWTSREPVELSQLTDITRLDAAGDEVWSTAGPVVRGYAFGWALACDDGGHVFAHSSARLGDGVSGGDVSTGGVTFFDPAGRRLATYQPPWPVDFAALEAGVWTEGGSFEAWFDAAGVQRGESRPVQYGSLRCADLDIAHHAAPGWVVLRRTPNRFEMVQALTDGAGTRYFCDRGRLFAVDTEGRVVVAAEAERIELLAIGPERSLLVRLEPSVVAALGG